MDYNKKYRDRQTFQDSKTSLSDIAKDSTKVSFYREKNSHKGISEFKDIKVLLAKQVNQSFLNEISQLQKLEYLEIETITAEDLTDIGNLSNLRTLKIYGIRKANNFSFINKLPNLNVLLIENTKQISDLGFLSNAHNLSVIGFEESMYTKQKLDSLQPLSNLQNLEALFMSSVQLKDKNLNYLSSMPNLKYFAPARFAPKSSFVSLRKALPLLVCNWCDKYEI
ncbi:hypothetical protein OO007_06755 [Cocleimonas sp. KMM 6892]|uniref:leucine-rich repeat domain-containing protein n=1 Tax=unclassified Cocleimonas TaxID=2639732 RepID=UPI002DB7A4EA|nr:MULTISPECIES: hypothetical protein [unclassified Cocleimonas]MEB8431923.1 hypothetical protein [Cocleimonas sp. KMM 6892]MEC4714991.1 hypothetical protein [Cocleimonas sp. KMM 6895]MEC4744195.1 hypothetical protein [Cocleimonas sp. KMM 6896]